MGTSVPVGERHRDCELIKERKGDSRRGSIRNGVGSAQLHTRVGDLDSFRPADESGSGGAADGR